MDDWLRTFLFILVICPIFSLVYSLAILLVIYIAGEGGKILLDGTNRVAEFFKHKFRRPFLVYYVIVLCIYTIITILAVVTQNETLWKIIEFPLKIF